MIKFPKEKTTSPRADARLSSAVMKDAGKLTQGNQGWMNMRELTLARLVPVFLSFFCPRILINLFVIDFHTLSQRPFVCPECSATFTRVSHLKAHVRGHASDSEKNYACSEPGCDKKFWTNQHLRKHVEVMHHGKTYNVSIILFGFASSSLTLLVNTLIFLVHSMRRKVS